MPRELIGIIYRSILKPVLFTQDPERVHNGFSKYGNLLGRFKLTRWLLRLMLDYNNSKLEQDVTGIHFRNPVGLSAGFDKDANLLDILSSIGFGFMQVGSITLDAYEGNPKPRLYRLPKSLGLVVYYGLKNIGADKIISRIRRRKVTEFPLSISVAKTNCEATSSEKGGINDYIESLRKLEHENIGDFYTINISCPNTFGGEPFTTPAKLDKLFREVAKLKIVKPLFVKMPVDLPWKEFNKLLEIIVRYKLTGVIIGNLTKARNPKLIRDEIPEHVIGGISGKPTWELSNKLITKTYSEYGDKLVIIGVGGIFSAEDAYEKIKRGATLVQLIAGMIYEGPQLIGKINKQLVQLLKRDGYTTISDAIGAYHREII